MEMNLGVGFKRKTSRVWLGKAKVMAHVD